MCFYYVTASNPFAGPIILVNPANPFSTAMPRRPTPISGYDQFTRAKSQSNPPINMLGQKIMMKNQAMNPKTQTKSAAAAKQPQSANSNKSQANNPTTAKNVSKPPKSSGNRPTGGFGANKKPVSVNIIYL